MSSFSSPVATQYVNDLEPLLRSNRDNYLAGPHTPDRQKAALDYFDQQWAHLRSSAACGGAVLGIAGRRCIADRARGGAWDWFSYYRDPITIGHF
jgi:hypothetical protein